MLAECKAECEGWFPRLVGRLRRVVDGFIARACAGLFPDQPKVGTGPAEEPAPRKVVRKQIEAGKVTECKHCGKAHPMYANGTMCFNAFFYIWERDMLQMAKKEPGWRKLANALGFRDAKIDAPWTHPDEGRLIPYQNIKTKEFLIK